MQKKYTIIDIAKMAKVSKSTVSRVINGEADVKEETRKRIEDLMNTLNFSPNKYAQMMKTEAPKTLLIAPTRLDSYAENRTIRGLLDTLDKRYQSMIIESGFSPERLQEGIEHNLKYVDALAIFGISHDHLAYLKKICCQKPIVIFGQSEADYFSIVNQDYDAMQDLLLYMKMRTTKKIKKMIYLAIDNDDLTTGYTRTASVQDFCHKQGIDLTIQFTTFHAFDAYEAIKNLSLEDVSLIVCATDKIAIGAEKYLRDLNNQEIALCGVGDYLGLNFLIDDYVALRYPFKTMGAIAGNYILKGEISPQTIVMPYEIVDYQKEKSMKKIGEKR